MIDNKKELAAEFVWRVFQETEAIIQNSHFEYASGRHGSIYIDHHAVYTDLNAVFNMCWFMADKIHDSQDVGEIDIVFGPEGGGIILAHFLKEHLNLFGGDEVFLWAKKQYDGNGLRSFVLPQAFIKRVYGKKIFLIDDVLTSGGTFLELAELLSQYGASVVACGCLWNRGGITASVLGEIPLFSLLEKKLDDWPPADCPLCRNGVPINTKYGHGRKPR